MESTPHCLLENSSCASFPVQHLCSTEWERRAESSVAVNIPEAYSSGGPSAKPGASAAVGVVAGCSGLTLSSRERRDHSRDGETG